MAVTAGGFAEPTVCVRLPDRPDARQPAVAGSAAPQSAWRRSWRGSIGRSRWAGCQCGVRRAAPAGWWSWRARGTTACRADAVPRLDEAAAREADPGVRLGAACRAVAMADPGNHSPYGGHRAKARRSRGPRGRPWGATGRGAACRAVVVAGQGTPSLPSGGRGWPGELWPVGRWSWRAGWAAHAWWPPRGLGEPRPVRRTPWWGWVTRGIPGAVVVAGLREPRSVGGCRGAAGLRGVGPDHGVTPVNRSVSRSAPGAGWARW